MDRPAREDGIEITPEMIEAAVEIIWGELGGAELGGLFSASDLASSVYLAMERSKREAPASHL